MEEIVSKQGREHEEEADMISFHKLTNLSLSFLPSFVGFFQAKKLYSNQEETTARVEHQSAGIFEKAIFPSKCISWFPSLEDVCLAFMKFEGLLFDLKIHGQTTPIFPQLRKLKMYACSFTHLWKNIPSRFQGFQNLRYLEVSGCCGLKYVFSHLIARELLNLEEVKIAECPDMETIVRITEENEEEATKYMILFPKLNTFELEDLPRLTSLCPEGFTFLWSSTKNMHLKKCENLKTLGAVIPQRKKLENKSVMDSTSHDFSTSPTRSSNWCPAGCGCAPYSRPNAHRPIDILQRPINLEVTPTNLEDSNDDDNLENLTVRDCYSMEVIFQLKGPKHEESSHSVEAFNKLRSLQLDILPSLTRVWETGSSQPMLTGSSFGNLKSLRVYYCNQLKYLFSSSLVKLLVSIEDIEVEFCEKMEEIVAAEEETDETITLPKVKSIKLANLPKLKYFCGEAYTLKLPSLELLEVKKVQNLRRFAPKLIGTHNPRLQVRTALGQAEWKGDLNATLRNIYVTSKNEDDEIESEDEDDEIESDGEDDEIESDGEDDEIDRKDEDIFKIDRKDEDIFKIDWKDEDDKIDWKDEDDKIDRKDEDIFKIDRKAEDDKINRKDEDDKIDRKDEDHKINRKDEDHKIDRKDEDHKINKKDEDDKINRKDEDDKINRGKKEVDEYNLGGLLLYWRW